MMTEKLLFSELFSSMKINNLVKFYRKKINPKHVRVRLITDKSVDGAFIGGWFNPFWEECGDPTPIEIDVTVSSKDYKISNKDRGLYDELFITTVNHEYVHWEQVKQKRYDKMSEEEREKEAYSRESLFEFLSF